MDKILTLPLVCSIHDTQIGNATKRRIFRFRSLSFTYKLHRLMYDWVKMYSSSNVVCFPGRECNPRSVVVESGSPLLLRQWLGRSPCQPEQQQNWIGQWASKGPLVIVKMAEEENVKVAVRVRPFNKREKDRKAKMIISMNGGSTTITDPSDGDSKR